VAVEPDDVESPMTEMALPPAVTGALTGAVTWLPPTAESAPEVVSPVVPDGAIGAVAVEPEDVESPMTEMALPPAVTGALTGAVTWLPPTAESAPDVESPDVVDAPAGADDAAGVGVCEPEDEESPSTDTLLPLTVMGTATAAVAWLPPPAESSPEVLPSLTSGAFGVAA